MTLISCPECAKTVSEEHAACPHCGSPTANAPGAARKFAPEGDDISSPGEKGWKIVRLIGVLLMMTGAIAWTAGSSDAAMVLLLGGVIFLGGLLGAWMTRDSTH
ncbi:MAG: hypothetical protein KF804_06430 [Burkholderiales bacterium]|jgi:hypothetical protein|nr:hypothetical protein [Burkholderiales bacterium]